MKKLILSALTTITATFVFAQHKIIVAKEGNADFTTIQAAINSVPNYSSTVTVIEIKKGIYKEKLELPVSKQHVTLIGDSRAETIITYDDYAAKPDSGGKAMGTSGSAGFHLYGSDFTAINITFQNTAGPIGQAVAVRVTGNHAYFKNCAFLGFQDTLYTHGFGTFELYENCYIEGTVDFIFGGATAWFENCEIFCKKGGYISAAATPDTAKFGYVFSKCKITSDAAAGSFYLGRPWRPYAKTVFIQCELPEQINAAGWQVWSNKDNLSTTYYAEYENKGPGFAPASRLPWTHQLSKDEIKQYTISTVLNGWNPNR